MKCSLGISNFLEEISSLSPSVLFLYFFALIAEEGFVMSSCYSLEFCIQVLISFLFSFAFCLFFSQLFARPPQTLSCVQFFVIPWTEIHQASLSVRFPRQEYWSGLLFPSLGDLPHPGIRPLSPSLQNVSGIAGGFVNIKPPGKPPQYQYLLLNLVNFKIKDKRLSLASFIIWTLTFVSSFLSLAKC